MTLTLGNPLAGSMSSSVKFSKATIDVNGKSLSTGAKADNDVVSEFLGKGLGDKAFLQQKILKNIGYCSNALKLAENGISSIASTIASMLAIVAQAESGSDENRAVLNDILQQKINQVAKETTSTKFNERQLLVGDFGSNSNVRTHYNTKTVDVRKQGAGAGANFAGSGAKDQKILDFSNPALFANLTAGQFIILRGEKFTFVDGVPANENEVTIGKTPAEMASNLTTAIRSSSAEGLRAYNVTARNGQTMIAQRSASSTAIPLIVPASIDASSTPSTYSFEFLGPANPGSSITVAGETFTFGAGSGQVSPGANYEDSGDNLVAAIQNNLNTKDLIDQGFLTVSTNNWGVVTIRSTLSEAILGFQYNFTLGEIRNDNITISGATTYGQTITFSNVPADGDIVTLGGVNFTFDSNPTNNSGGTGDVTHVSRENGVGAQSARVSAINLNNKILANPTTAALVAAGTLSVIVDNNGNFTVFSDTDVGLSFIPIGGVAPTNPVIKNAAISTADTSVLRAAIDVSEIRNIEGFIGTPVSSFEVLAGATSAGGSGAAAALYQRVTGQLPPTASADGDSFAVIEAKIAGRTFQALLWKDAAAANLDSRAIVFKEAGTGETFTLNTGTNNYNPDITSNVGGLADDIKTLFSTTQFAQTRDLEIFTAGGQIIDETATVIGDVTGMTVSLNSTDFDNKTFQDFKIKESPEGGVTFTATIDGRDFSTSLAVNELAEGAALKLENPDTADALVINIGKGGLNSLGDAKNYSIIGQAMKKALLSIGIGLDVKIGIEAKAKVVVQIDDISTNKLYRDNKGDYIQGINLLTKHSTKVAHEVITNALKLARGAEAKIISNNRAITTYVEALSNARGITKESSDSYLNTDIIESATAFSEAVKSLVGSISTLEAGNKVSDAAQRVISSVSAPAA